ncbi:MAG: pseudouridine synthase, partial [Chloroflexota bacterium]|nr:pseudouridine synthase [Chloroflexota bacterium]
MLERLHKILARAGVAALRPAEDLIMQGRVTVNGRVVRELGARADADNDVIAVDGAIVQVPGRDAAHRYLMLHKPPGVISTAQDTHDRPTVLQLVPNDVRVFPVGRLDADSEGLLLLTDDGDLAYRLTHPRFEVDKEYRVLVDRTPQLAELRRWRIGVPLEDGEMTAPAWAEVLERSAEGTWLRIVMREGKKRQIREVARVLGLSVLRLIRVREGPLSLGDLSPGAWRELTQTEVEALRAHTEHVPSREADEEQERMMSEQDRDRPRRLRVVRRPQREDRPRAAGAGEFDRPPIAREQTGGSDAAPEPATRPPREERGPRAAREMQPHFSERRRPPESSDRGRLNRAPSRSEEEARPFAPRGGSPTGARPGSRRPDMDRRADDRSGGASPERRGFGRATPPGADREDRRGEFNRDSQREDRRGGFNRDPQRERRSAPPERGYGGRPGARTPDRTPDRDRPRRDDNRSFSERRPQSSPGPRRAESGRYDSGRDNQQRGNLRAGLGSRRPNDNRGGNQGRNDYGRGGQRRNDGGYRRPGGPGYDDAPEPNGNVREDRGNARAAQPNGNVREDRGNARGPQRPSGRFSGGGSSSGRGFGGRQEGHGPQRAPGGARG